MNSSTLINRGIDRRHFLRQTSLGGIALHAMLQSNGLQASDLSKPLSHIRPRAKNVIFLFMCGGASHLETFDWKPALEKYAGKTASQIFSPSDLAGFNPEKTLEECRILPPVFPFRQHGKSGAWISDIYPRLTEVSDDIAFIKSLTIDSAIHSVGQILMHTGHNRSGFPSIGSWASYGLGSENDNLPSYVVMKDGFTTMGESTLHQGMLPNRYRATIARVEDGKPPFDNLSSAPGISRDVQRKYLSALNRLNRLHHADHLSQPELAGRIASFEMAFRLQTAAPEVFDLSREPESIRTLYGDNQFSNHCLTARRLVESGVRFVEILDGADGRKWDAHGNRGGLIDNHRDNAARTDQGITALIKDLKSRGLLDETLVVWATEFGRTPFEEANRGKKIGRGHHHKGFTVWMAGGGIKPGISFGSTDELGFHAADDEVTFHDFHATILHLLGLDHEKLTYRHNSRDVRLTDVYGDVVHPIIS